jgi:hypothetical protein
VSHFARIRHRLPHIADGYDIHAGVYVFANGDRVYRNASFVTSLSVHRGDAIRERVKRARKAKP